MPLMLTLLSFAFAFGVLAYAILVLRNDAAGTLYSDPYFWSEQHHDFDGKTTIPRQYERQYDDGDEAPHAAPLWRMLLVRWSRMGSSCAVQLHAAKLAAATAVTRIASCTHACAKHLEAWGTQLEAHSPSPESPTIELTLALGTHGRMPFDLHTDKIGSFVGSDGSEHLVNGHPCYAHTKRSDVRLWWSSGRWWLGKLSELGTSRGWLKTVAVPEGQPAPRAEEHVPPSTGWVVYNPMEREWHAVPQLTCSALVHNAVASAADRTPPPPARAYAQGALSCTPPSPSPLGATAAGHLGTTAAAMTTVQPPSPPSPLSQGIESYPVVLSDDQLLEIAQVAFQGIESYPVALSDDQLLEIAQAAALAADAAATMAAATMAAATMDLRGHMLVSEHLSHASREDEERPALATPPTGPGLLSLPPPPASTVATPAIPTLALTPALTPAPTPAPPSAHGTDEHEGSHSSGGALHSGGAIPMLAPEMMKKAQAVMEQEAAAGSSTMPQWWSSISSGSRQHLVGGGGAAAAGGCSPPQPTRPALTHESREGSPERERTTNTPRSQTPFREGHVQNLSARLVKALPMLSPRSSTLSSIRVPAVMSARRSSTGHASLATRRSEVRF